MPLEDRWVRMATKNAFMLSVSLKTGFPGTREGDSQIAAAEKCLCHCLFPCCLNTKIHEARGKSYFVDF